MMLKIGDRVKPGGEVVAVGMLGGERYYFLKDRHGVISLMPADIIENAATGGGKVE